MIQAKIWYVLGTFYEEGISDILKPDEQESKLLYRLASCRNLPEAVIKMERFENDDEEGYESYDYYAYLNHKKKHKRDHIHKKNSSDKRLSRRQSKFEKRHSKGMMSDDLSINTNRLSNGNTSDVGSLSSDNAIRSMGILVNNGDRRNSVSTFNTNVTEYRRGSITTLTSTEYRRSSISTNGNEYRRGSISTMASNGNIISSRVSSINGNYTDTEGSSYDNYSTVKTLDTLKSGGDIDINSAYNEVMERRNTLSKKNSILRKGSFLNITSLFDKHDHSNVRSDSESISTNTIKGYNSIVDPTPVNKYYVKNHYIASAILSLLNIPQALILPYPTQIPTPSVPSTPSTILSHTPSLRTKSAMSTTSLINPVPSSSSINNLMRKGSISNSSNYQTLLQSKMRNTSKSSSVQSKSLNRNVNRSQDKIIHRTSNPIGKIIYTNDDNDSDSSTTSISSDESDDEYNENSDDTKKLSNIKNTRPSNQPKFIISFSNNSKNKDNEGSGINKEEYSNDIIFNSPTMMEKDTIYQNKKYSNSDSKLSTIESSEKQNLELIHPIQKSKTVLGHKGHKKNGSLNIDNFTPLKPSTTALSDVDSVSSYKNSEFSSVQGNSVYSHYPRSSYSSAASLTQLDEMKNKTKNSQAVENSSAGIIVNKRTSSLNKFKIGKSRSENEKVNLLQNNNTNNRISANKSKSNNNSNNISVNRNNTNNVYNILEKKINRNYSFNSSTNILDNPIVDSSPSLSEQISEQFNQIMEKDSSDLSDPGEVVDINDNNTEVSETIITENDSSTVDYSYDVESSNDYSYEDYSVFEKRTPILPFNNMMHTTYTFGGSTASSSTPYDNNSYYTSSSHNTGSNVNTEIVSTVTSSTSKSKLKSKNKKRSLLKMRSIINSFSTEKERTNSLKKREELLNNTSFSFSANSKDNNKKIYLKRYNRSESQSSTNSNLHRSSTLESNPNPNVSYNTSMIMNEPPIDDNYSELSKLHNKSFMKKSKEILKNKISKSKLLLHHKGSTTFNKSNKRKSSRDKSFIGKEPSIIDDSVYDGGEHSFIEENNLTYTSKHSTSSKNSRIYRHAQSLYDPNQDQLKSSHKFSEFDTFKRTYSLINKNYTSEDNGSESGNHILLENDYIKAYSSAKPEDLYDK